MVSFINFEAVSKFDEQQAVQMTLNVNSINMIEYYPNEAIIQIYRPCDIEVTNSDRITVRDQSVNTLRKFFEASYTEFHDLRPNYESEEEAQKENMNSTLPYFIKVTGEKGGDTRDLIINLSNIAVIAPSGEGLDSISIYFHKAPGHEKNTSYINIKGRNQCIAILDFLDGYNFHFDLRPGYFPKPVE